MLLMRVMFRTTTIALAVAACAGICVAVAGAAGAATAGAATAGAGSVRVQLTAGQAAFLSATLGPARASQRRYGIPASVTIAQAILESGWGGSTLTRSTNNFFGMTCARGRRGPIATGCREAPDRVCDHTGCRVGTNSFRVYRSARDSFRDHGRQVATARRYARARAHRADPDRFVIEMQRAGYATEPRYAELLIRLMVRYDLYRHNAR